METKTVQKLTLLSMGCDLKKAQKLDDNQTLPLAVIFGKVTKLHSKLGDDGEPEVSLLGKFEGRNSVSGDVFLSSRLILPRSLQAPLVEMFIHDDELEAVEFAYQISASKNGYDSHVLYTPREADELERLRSLVDSKLSAQAPGESGAPAPAPGGVAGSPKEPPKK